MGLKVREEREKTNKDKDKGDKNRDNLPSELNFLFTLFIDPQCKLRYYKLSIALPASYGHLPSLSRSSH